MHLDVNVWFTLELFERGPSGRVTVEGGEGVGGGRVVFFVRCGIDRCEGHAGFGIFTGTFDCELLRRSCEGRRFDYLRTDDGFLAQGHCNSSRRLSSLVPRRLSKLKFMEETVM